MATTSYGTPYVQSSDLVSGWPTASLNVADRIDAVSYAGNGLNAQTGTTYTLVVGDAGKTVTLNNAAAVAVTLPQDSVANLPTGAVVNFYNLGAGTVTISAGAGATLQGGSLTAAQYGYAAVIKLSANTYGPVQAVATAPGLAIVTPTSTANSGGSVTVTGSQVAFSGVTSVSLNGVFTSSYEQYEIVIHNTCTGSGFTAFRLRASGTDTTTGYTFQTMVASGTTITGGRNTLGYWGLTQNRTSGLALAKSTIYRPQLAQTKGFLTLGNDPISDAYVYVSTGLCTSTAAHDGFTLYDSSGGTITGTVRVYGYRNS